MKLIRLLLPALLLLCGSPLWAAGGRDVAEGALPAEPLSDRVVVRFIEISGTRITRSGLIVREMSVREGMRLRSDSLAELLEQNRLRLVNMALFNEVNQRIVRVNDSTIDWKLQLRERWYIWPAASVQLADRNFNVWWREQNHDLRRVNLALSLTDQNFRGRLERLSATVQLGYIRRFGFDYQRPYIDKAQRIGMGLSFSYAGQQEVAYATDSNKLLFVRGHEPLAHFTDINLMLSYRPAYATRHIFQLSYLSRALSDTITALNADFTSGSQQHLRMLQLFYRMDINRVDNWNYPLLGRKLVLASWMRYGLEGMRFQWLAHAEAAGFARPLPRWYVSAVGRAQLSLPAGQPYVLRAGMGRGSDYVRGYEYYVVDGYHYGLLRLNLKRELLNHTFKGLPVPYLSQLPLRLYPKVFADAGYAWNPDAGNSFLNNRLLYSAGLGLDIVTAYELKLRVEWAHNHLGQNGLYLHLTSE